MQLATLELNILKSSLWGTAIAVPQEFDEWGKVLALEKAQSVLGLVANAVLSDAEAASSAYSHTMPSASSTTCSQPASKQSGRIDSRNSNEHRSNPPGHPHRAGESLAPLAYEPIGPEDVMEG